MNDTHGTCAIDMDRCGSDVLWTLVLFETERGLFYWRSRFRYTRNKICALRLIYDATLLAQVVAGSVIMGI